VAPLFYGNFYRLVVIGDSHRSLDPMRRRLLTWKRFVIVVLSNAVVVLVIVVADQQIRTRRGLLLLPAAANIVLNGQGGKVRGEHDDVPATQE
jgi:hypothetical protein